MGKDNSDLFTGLVMGILIGGAMALWFSFSSIQKAVDHANEEWERCEYVVPHEQIEDTPSEWRDIEPTPTGDSWCVNTK